MTRRFALVIGSAAGVALTVASYVADARVGCDRSAHSVGAARADAPILETFSVEERPDGATTDDEWHRCYRHVMRPGEYADEILCNVTAAGRLSRDDDYPVCGHFEDHSWAMRNVTGARVGLIEGTSRANECATAWRHPVPDGWAVRIAADGFAWSLDVRGKGDETGVVWACECTFVTMRWP